MRDLDVVVWGATGFTGQLATAYLKGDQSQFYSTTLKGPAASGLKWAVAGRNQSKLEALGAPEVIVADADDVAAIERFVARTKVVVAVAGPFR
jgi:short subunit dehydrogenase-like uncharacterized protein